MKRKRIHIHDGVLVRVSKINLNIVFARSEAVFLSVFLNCSNLHTYKRIKTVQEHFEAEMPKIFRTVS